MSRLAVRTVMLSLLLLVAASCSGDGSEEASATGDQPGGATSATGVTAVTGATGATGATSATSAGPAQAIEGGPLDAGTYRFDGFGETLTLTLGEGWEAFVFTEPVKGQTLLGQTFVLFNADHPAANLAFVQSSRVVDPEKDWDEADNLDPMPADLAAWFAEHPRHEAEAPVEITVAGRPATSVDMTVVSVPKNGWPACGGQCVTWIPASVDNENGPLKTDDLVFAGGLGEVDRQIVVEVGGQQLLIDIGAADRKSFDAFVPLAEEVLGTVQIG